MIIINFYKYNSCSGSKYSNYTFNFLASLDRRLSRTSRTGGLSVKYYKLVYLLDCWRVMTSQYILSHRCLLCLLKDLAVKKFRQVVNYSSEYNNSVTHRVR